MRRFGAAALTSLALSACALKGDVRRVEQEVQQLRAEMARADSTRADFFEFAFQQMIALEQQIIDSLAVQERRLALFRGDVRSDMTEVQRQLVQIQELTGQSQQRLSEVQARLEDRERRPTVSPGPADSGAAPSTGPEEIYRVSMQQLRRGSPQTARMGFRLLLDQYPTHELAADAQFHIGQSWEPSNPDSAVVAYELVARDHADSPRAPTALYRLGLIAEQQGDPDAARGYYTRVVSGYPRSEEAELARAKLNPGS